jgi:hypothetical protein
LHRAPVIVQLATSNVPSDMRMVRNVANTIHTVSAIYIAFGAAATNVP